MSTVRNSSFVSNSFDIVEYKNVKCRLQIGFKMQTEALIVASFDTRYILNDDLRLILLLRDPNVGLVISFAKISY